MVRPSWASTTASSTSGRSVTQTGQPGPMITSSVSGKSERSPNLAMDCSWLPQTCITERGSASGGQRCSSTEARARAFSGSRNLSSRAPSSERMSAIVPTPLIPDSRFPIPGSLRRGDLSPDIGGHHVRLGLLEQQVVQGERLADLLRGDLPDGEPHVVQDVVARLDRLVPDAQAGAPAHPPEHHPAGW